MKLFSNIESLTETVGPRNELDDTMTFPLLIQRILGQHILNPNWTWKKFILYQFASASLIFYICLGTKEKLSKTTNINDIAEASFTYAIIGIMITKYLLFVNGRISMRILYIKAKTGVLLTISEESYDEKIRMVKKTKRVMKILFSTVVLPVLSYVLRVLWFYVNGERVLLSKTTSTLLPMSSPFYEIATTFHSIFMSGTACTIIVINMWFIFFLNLYCSACDCMVKILDVKKEKDEDEKIYALRLSDQLRTFYLRHVKLVEYQNILNKTFKWQTIVPSITVIILSCILMLSMSKEFDSAFGTNIMPTFFEVFIYNWYGEQVKTKSNNIKDALIHFDWVNLQLKDKKSYYVIMSFMNKDFSVITAVGSELSLITMTSVLKASYQVFTMLQSFEN